MARELYREELLRLGRFLERMGGVRAESYRLTAAMAAFAQARQRLFEKYRGLGGRVWSEALMGFQRGDWSLLDAQAEAGPPARGVPVALVGGPLRAPDLCLFDEVEAAGGVVALDATTTGERSLPPPFDLHRMREAPLDALLDAYLRIPEAFQRPNRRLHAYLETAVKRLDIRGIILRHYVWCDTWQVEAARLGEATGLQVLRLDVGEESDSARQAGRIAAFMEVLA